MAEITNRNVRNRKAICWIPCCQIALSLKFFLLQEIITNFDYGKKRREVMPTGRAKCQLFKLINKSNRLLIVDLDDFSDECSPSKSEDSSSSKAIHQNIEMEELNWMPDGLKHNNYFLVAEYRAENVSESLKFAYVNAQA